MSLLTEILASLSRCSDKIVARDKVQELTSEQMIGAAATAAGIYSARGAGRMVGLLLPSCALYPVAILGALWEGRVPVPLNPLLKARELKHILQETGIDTLVVQDAATAAQLPGLQCILAQELSRGPAPSPSPAPAAPGDTAVLLYTSGTTGWPKGVPLTHGNLLTNARGIIDRLGGCPDDVFVAVLPLFHAFGLTGTMVVPMLLGACVTYTQFSPRTTLRLLAERRATAFLAVPSMYRLLAHSRGCGCDLPALRLALSGGDALSFAVREAYRERFGRELLEGYGLTETSPVVSVNAPESNRPGTVGRPLPGVVIRVVDEAGACRPSGQDGEVQVRGPSVMPGYYKRPEEDRQAFTADGWFRTGDLGRLDADGYLTISGRLKELIVRDGEKVMPREVEEVLLQHPRVLDACVVGVPDGDRGEALEAFVVPAEQAPTAEELRAFCRGRLADFKVPRRFVISRDLPRGPIGKILKRALKEC